MTDTVESLVAQVIRPLVTADGGECLLVRHDENEVVLELRGACLGCPGKHYTRTAVIEPLLRTVVGPGVRIVVQ